MPRFDKLEFGPSPDDPQAPSEAGPRQHDEAYWMEQALEHRRNGHYENALRFYSRALELDKSLAAGWVGQVQMLVLLEEFRQAEMWSRTGLGLLPSHGALLAGRAQAFCRMRDMKKAQELSDAALAQDGQNGYGWLVRGELMVATRHQTDHHCFESARHFDQDWLVLLEIALVYLYYRVPSKALKWAQQAVEKAPDRYYAWYVQGLCQGHLGFDGQAQRSYRRCLELCPRHADADRQLRELKQQRWSLVRILHRVLRWS
jgi:tetratricopeptide (TPR) repeat protein